MGKIRNSSAIARKESFEEKMKVQVKFDGKNEEIDLVSGATVADIFKKLNLSTEVYLVKRGADIIIETEPLNNKDALEFIKVISGG